MNDGRLVWGTNKRSPSMHSWHVSPVQADRVLGTSVWCRCWFLLLEVGSIAQKVFLGMLENGMPFAEVQSSTNKSVSLPLFLFRLQGGVPFERLLE